MAATGLVLPTQRVMALPPSSEASLAAAARAGAGVLAWMGSGTGASMHAMDASARFLYRRWLLQILLLLRIRGPQRYGAISRSLGRLPGESLAPKLAALVKRGIVSREESETSREVTYVLTPAGGPLADGVFALVTGKAEHARALGRGESWATAMDPRAAVPGPDPLGEWREAVGAFAAAQAPVRAVSGFEEPLRTAMRFTRACVRKWHAPVLGTLAMSGPLRFRDLKAALGAGDEALSSALSELATLASVEKLEDGSYRLAPAGAYDLSLGAPPVAYLALHEP